MGVLRPLKVVITNYPQGQVEHFDVANNPEDESAGTRKLPFGPIFNCCELGTLGPPPSFITKTKMRC